MDTYFNTNFTKILSLGFNCYPKFFISKVIKPVYGETELFDYVGSSMWSNNLLLLNDFAGLTDKNNFALMPILEGEPPIVTNTKYYIRFRHDLKTVAESQTVEFLEKMNRRVSRFKKNIASSDHVLFIKMQETQDGRIKYGQEEITCEAEHDAIEEFIDILYMKYQCRKVTVIYINLESDGWNKRGDVLSVKINAIGKDWERAHLDIQDLFLVKDVIGQLESRFLR